MGNKFLIKQKPKSNQKKSQRKQVKPLWALRMLDGLKYSTLIEALQRGESLTSEQVINLFRLSKKRNSNIEDDVKNYKAPI